MCLRNILKDFTIDNMKKTGLNGYVYDLFVNHNIIDISNILDIHICLMKKHEII